MVTSGSVLIASSQVINHRVMPCAVLNVVRDLNMEKMDLDDKLSVRLDAQPKPEWFGEDFSSVPLDELSKVLNAMEADGWSLHTVNFQQYQGGITRDVYVFHMA